MYISICLYSRKLFVLNRGVVMNLKIKLNVVLLAIVTISIGAIIFAAYNMSKAELTKSVLRENRNLAEKTASDIEKTVEKEFSMLESMAKFPSITDPEIDMLDKWKKVNAVIQGNQRYSGLAFYNNEGVGYNSKGKLVDNHTKDYMVGALKGKRGMMDPHKHVRSFSCKLCSASLCSRRQVNCSSFLSH